MAKVWDEKDNEFLKENYMKYSNQELAEMFDVTKKSIQGKLRRLGLHRRDEEPVVKKKVASPPTPSTREERQEDKPLIRKKRLNFKVPEGKPIVPPPAPYRPMEMTEKRKRAIREFENAMQILFQGDVDKAKAEFQFIKDKFPRELDIVHKAQSWLDHLDRQPQPEPRTPEEHYMVGIRCSQRNRMEEALFHFHRALTLDPTYLDARYNIACITCRKGEHADAIAELEAIAEEDDRFIDAAMEDSDFEPLWNHPDFIDLIKQYIEEDDETD
ncbi:MAG TPA: tetratricopeptide repeat protein [bacterium]|nr:tetratricopeptide repeat protein [bacterium]